MAGHCNLWTVAPYGKKADMAIVWIASYPKSGNTWIRAFLANHYANGTEPMSLEAIRESSRGDAEIWPYQKVLDQAVKTLPTERALALRPQAHLALATSQDGDLLVKTHSPYTFASGQQIITPEVTGGAIHIVRNPWDVAVSYADHFGKSYEDTAVDMVNTGLAIWPNPAQVVQPVGDWSNHASSWLDAKIPRLTVRYEDLVTRPRETFAMIVKFACMDEDPERLERAIKFSSFEELSEQEAAVGFAERSKVSEKFFREGSVGGWREVLPQAVVRQIAKDHRKMARTLKYMTSDGRILV
jgi:hypothetical protein